MSAKECSTQHVPGAVFTSPTPDQMYEASKAVNGGAGILHIVKNYTGDVMNFDLAAEMLQGATASMLRPFSPTTMSRSKIACTPRAVAASA